MHRIFHLMRSVRQSRKFHRITLKAHAASPVVCDSCPANTDLIATLLWNEIMCHILCNRIFINAELCAVATVYIRLRRSHAIPLHLVVICIKLEHHTKLRHITKLLHRIIGKCRLDRSVSIDLIGNPTLTCRYRRHTVSKSDACPFLCHFDFRFLGSRIWSAGRIFVRQVHGCDLPLGITHRHQVAAVIVVWCTPEVWLRDHLNHFHTTIAV